MKKTSAISVTLCASLVLSACGSTYDKLGDSNSVGAAGYRPTVDLAISGKDSAQYANDLSYCRNLAIQKQQTASQEAQEDTATAALDGALSGALIGAVTNPDSDSLPGGNRTEQAVAGAVAGALLSVFGAGGRTKAISASARATIDKCLKVRDYVIY